MHRPAALSLCALVAAAGVTAAPAPFPRPAKSAFSWFDGWDKPVDPAGDCRFDRKGDKLTITVPGKGHELNVGRDHLNPARLQRDVVESFVVQVRLEEFRRVSPDGFQMAGIYLTDGHWSLYMSRGIHNRSGRGDHLLHVLCRGRGEAQMDIFGLNQRRWSERELSFWTRLPDRQIIYLQLRRSGGRLQMAYSLNGKEWTQLFYSLRLPLPQRLKIGVFAEARAATPFIAVFDQFRLTPLSRRGR